MIPASAPTGEIAMEPMKPNPLQRWWRERVVPALKHQGKDKPFRLRPGWLALSGLAIWVGGMHLFSANGAVTYHPPLGEYAHTLKSVPDGFLWGVATAGYQWEGGDTASNWAKWEAAGKVKEPSGKAANGWELYERDLDLAKDMGLNAFRFSIEWSRIEPRQGQIDWQAVARYRAMLRAMHARGMTPIVTLMHNTYPAWVDGLAPKGRGGWETDKAIEAYLRFVDFAAREFGQDIRYYLTFNEPTVMVEAGYLVGIWPPGKADVAAFARASVNVIKAHSRAYDVIHQRDPDAMVSFNNYAAAYQVSLDPKKDALPAPGDDWFLKAFSDMLVPFRDDPSGKKRAKMDYVAVDYYKRLTIPTQVIPPSPSQWHVYPEGFADVLDRYYKVFGLPILVAENGFATDNGKPRADGWTRERYLVEHVAQLQKAMDRGVPIIGYTYWTLTDNYEWGSFNDRFGLYRVECRNGDYRRIETPAVGVYKAIIQGRGVQPELVSKMAQP
jgi:beta-glucosidase